MGIPFLMALLFGGGAFFVVMKKNKILDKKIKWTAGLFSAVLGMLLGIGISIDVGEKIAKKYLTSTPVAVLETVNLLPFSGSSGAYIVTGENQYGEKVAWYLQEKEWFEKPFNYIIDRNMIVFTNATAPAKQLVKVNVGSFWKWFAIIPNKYRFVIPAGGLQEGRIVKNYKFIPKS